MKKNIVLFFACLCMCGILYAQDLNNHPKTISSNDNEELFVYKLYPTSNMWTFIKLDTSTGKLWQVQYDVQGSNRGEVCLSAESQVMEGQEINGRFELYPTQNTWTFIMLDRINGRTWQVQWAFEAENRFVRRLKFSWY